MVDLPHGQSIVGCRWVYKIKTKGDGFVERYKPHLVSKGFTQEYGVDYEKTFAPIAHVTSVRYLIAVAAVHRLPFYQMDVKNASAMETFKKKCTCNHLLVIHTQAVKFVAFVVLFMASSRLLELGLKSLAQLLFSRVSLQVLMTLLSSSEDPLLVSLLFFFMLMI